MNARSIPSFFPNLSSRFLLACLGLLLASVAFWTAPAHAQTMNTSTCTGSGCTPTLPPAGSFGMNFSGGAGTSAVGTALAGRGDTPIVGSVVEEVAQAASLKDSFASIGVEAKITGFQPGTTCAADCSASGAVINAVANSMAGAMSSHFMKVNGTNGGPAAANSYSAGGANTGVFATGAVIWQKQN